MSKQKKMAIYNSASRDEFKQLKLHLGHKVQVVDYSDRLNEIANLSVECEDCQEVLFDIDNPDWINPDGEGGEDE